MRASSLRQEVLIKSTAIDGFNTTQADLIRYNIASQKGYLLPRIFVLSLSTEDRKGLQLLFVRWVNWRQRERAQTLLYLDGDLPTAEVARLMNKHARTVGSTRQGWLKSGFDSLPDLPKSGAPRKIAPEQVQKIVAAATAEPLSTPQLLAMHISQGGTPVHLNTLMAALNAAGLVGKRTRHSLKTTR